MKDPLTMLVGCRTRKHSRFEVMRMSWAFMIALLASKGASVVIQLTLETLNRLFFVATGERWMAHTPALNASQIFRNDV